MAQPNSVKPLNNEGQILQFSLMNPKLSDEQIFGAIHNSDFQEFASPFAEKNTLDLNRQDEYGNTVLHYAVKYNNPQVVSFLMDSRCSVNVANFSGYHPIHYAAKCENQECGEILLKNRRTEVNAIDNKGQTPLFMAARCGNKNMVELLLDRNADLKQKDWNNFSVMHAAVLSGDVEIVKLLIQHHANYNVPDINQQSPCMMACKDNKVEIVAELLNAAIADNVDIVNLTDNAEETSLMHAVGKQSKDVVELLLAKGANPGIRRRDGQTALHIASALGHEDCVELLLSSMNVAQFYSRDKSKRNALHLAAMSNKPKVAKLLLEKNSSIESSSKESFLNVVDDKNRTALHYACISSSDLDVVKMLLQTGANVGIMDKDLRTPIVHAVMDENVEIVKVLLESSTNGDYISRVCIKADKNDYTALHHASKRGNRQIAELLVAKAGTLSNKSLDQCPIHVATEYGNLEVVKLLVEKDKDKCQVVDVNGSNSLLLATTYGHTDIFKYLCDSGWSPRVTNIHGQNALMLSAGSGNNEILKLALEKDIDLNNTDNYNNTALHYACSTDNSTGGEMLFSQGIIPNVMNKDKDTPLMVALKHGNFTVAEVFLTKERWKDVLNYRNKFNKIINMDCLIKFYPSMAKMILDRCVEHTVSHTIEGGGETIYNFELLDSGVHEKYSRRYWALRSMATARNEELLKHPISRKLLDYKWKKLGLYFYLVDTLFYLIFVICLNYYILSLSPPKSAKDSSIDSSTGCVLSSGQTSAAKPTISSGSLIAAQIIIYFFMAVKVALEIVKMFSKGFRYFLDYRVYLYFLLYIVTGLFLRNPENEPCVNEWQFGAASVFLTWGLLIFQIEHIPFVRTYTLMFQSVMITLLKALLIFGMLLMAFTISFYICLRFDESFDTVTEAFIKIIDMTIGELELVSFFYSEKNILFLDISLVLFVLFCIIMPIALMNLLVGLAVGDIEAMKKNASIDSLQIRIEYCYEVEIKLPKFIQRKNFIRRVVKQRGIYKNKILTYIKKRKTIKNVSVIAEAHEDQYQDEIQNMRLDKIESNMEEMLEAVKGKKNK